MLKRLNGRATGAIKSFSAHTAREKQFLLNEITQVKGLMPLLMKPRNKQPWSPEDKIELGGHLRRLSRLSPYFVVLLMPGGLFILPALSWWLDRRRTRTAAPTSPP